MFVSVMEYSQGADLDTHLKRYGCMREMEARLILLQVVSAPRYLAAQEQPIIHYDLKPANILFHSSNASSLEIKITDFGLSKLIQSRDGPHDNPTIELTSQGTGTYWYLPPECFDTVATPALATKWMCGPVASFFTRCSLADAHLPRVSRSGVYGRTNSLSPLPARCAFLTHRGCRKRRRISYKNVLSTTPRTATMSTNSARTLTCSAHHGDRHARNGRHRRCFHRRYHRRRWHQLPWRRGRGMPSPEWINKHLSAHKRGEIIHAKGWK
ncbi:putative tousled-like kinase II [Trypanosoma cruzi]|uniref:Putative tousled-like kinase II n=1 Tax=Trypanosoma cruzi TaxID=5693 RepID=A0A2V2WQZ5_TRYCR|nr:putative tousled-like kinase II [Trypanosoma cruzi]